jgi:hypothetical protein
LAVIFPRWTNKLPLIMGAATLLLLSSAVAGVWYYFSPWFTDVGYQPKQPVEFSHKLHAGELGLDCRYCHNTVEVGPRAAVPPTSTCMNCHQSLIKPESKKLAKVMTSFNKNEPIEWVRVHMLPDYAYFDHSVHLAAGVGCVTCHGRIDQMEVVRQSKPLSMGWCLDCHRDPKPNLRPRSEVTNMSYDAAGAKYDMTKDPERARRGHKVTPPEHCSGCHR